jgi:hypothetical protein
MFPRLSACYSADLDFYSTAEGATVSATPIWRYPDLPATGVQLLVGLGAAFFLSGPQNNSGLINTNGDRANTIKAGFGITLRYYPLSFLGAELETGGLFGEASTPRTNDMSFTHEWISNLGLSVIPWQRLTLMGRVRVVASAGVSYTRLVLAEDYKNFVRQQSPGVFLPDGPATGLGWYSRAGFHMVTPVRVFLEVAVRYAQSWPRFPDAAQSFWNRQLSAEAGVGYHF